METIANDYTLNENRIIVLKIYVVQYFSNDKPQYNMLKIFIWHNASTLIEYDKTFILETKKVSCITF